MTLPGPRTRLRAVSPEALGDVLVGLVALDADLFGAEAWDTAAWRGLVSTSGRRLTVVEDGDAVAAYALVGVVGDFAELLRIGVAQEQRRRGLASVLLTDAVSAARTAGAERMLLEVSEANDAARAFYDRAGFVPIDRRPGYYRDGAAALVLELDLTPTSGRDHSQGRMEP